MNISIRNTVVIGWGLAITSLLSMMAGHLGDHTLSWKVNQISTYAASAPYDYFITLSMLFASLLLIIVGALTSKYKILGSSYPIHFVSILSGASASGLLMLSIYEETARSLTILKQSSFWAIREQSFHDAGLQIFLYSSFTIITLIGSTIILCRINLIEKIFTSVKPISECWKYLKETVGLELTY